MITDQTMDSDVIDLQPNQSIVILSHHSNSIGSQAVDSKRCRKRKLFYDEDSPILDVVKVLTEHDRTFKVNYGMQAVQACKNQKPLPPNIRRHLVQVLCRDLIKRCNSSSPSTDQREQLATCIVNQLYPSLVGKEKKELKDSYYAPSFTVLDTKTGKKKSISPTGHVQYFFKNFWSSLKRNNDVTKTMVDPLIEESAECSDLPLDELQDLKKWLQNHKAPPIKVFDFLLKTYPLRRREILTARPENFWNILQEWPRLFDISGAIQQDFALSHLLTADKLTSKWESAAAKIAAYFQTTKKSLLNLGITTIKSDTEVAGFFKLAYLIRSKVKKMTQIDSVKEFIHVIDVDADIDSWALNRSAISVHPQIVCKGDISTLNFSEYFVVLENKAMKTETFISAIDLAYKSYYVFSYSFPNSCFGVWQFLDYNIFDMSQTVPVAPLVLELSSFVNF